MPIPPFVLVVRRRLPLLALILAGALGAVALAAPDAGKGDWPQYRGPQRTGISQETGLLKKWPEAGPKLVWRVPLGDGYSGIAVVGGRAYTMYSKGGEEFAAAFDVATGKESWKFRVDAARDDDMGAGPRSTPTVDGDVVFVVGAKGMVHALNAASGEKIWSKDLKAEVGAQVPQWGISTSPLVEGDLLLVDAGGGKNKSLAALDKKTGAVRWTAHSDRPGYSSPLAVTIAGVRQVLSFAGTSLVSVAATDGKVLWSLPWETSYDVNAAMPVLIPPDRVFISSGYDKGGAVYRVKKEGEGFKTEEVWNTRVMKNHFNSSIHYGGYLYGFDDATLKCVDAATGEEKWRQRGFQKGSLLIADGHLVILSEAGLLLLAEATSAAYKEEGRMQVLEGRTWTMPSLAGGKLYLRNQKEMVALELAG
jgi:outer membrane protein assembly factor BamB